MLIQAGASWQTRVAHTNEVIYSLRFETIQLPINKFTVRGTISIPTVEPSSVNAIVQRMIDVERTFIEA